MKRTLKTLDGLSEELKKLYKQDGDVYRLVLEDDDGDNDVGALKRAKEHEKQKRKEAEAELARLKKEKEDAEAADEADKAKRKGDIGALEKSWQDKLARKEAELNAAADALRGQLRTLLVDNVAQSLASEISTAPELLLPHIKARLTVEEIDGKPVTRVLGSDGKPSALTIDDYKKEVLANKAFAPILTASKASGSGASKAGGSGGADLSAYKKADGSTDWTKVAEGYKSDPQLLDKLNLSPAS